MKRQHRSLVAAAIFFYTLAWIIPVAAQSTSSPAERSPVAEPRLDDTAFRSFHEAINEYLLLQRRLRSEAPTLAVTTDPRRITNASDVLALSIQRARRNAKQGDMFDKTAARVVAERLRGALESTDVVQLLAQINDEPAFGERPRVHMRFPEGSSMATMPPQLLGALPPLPAELEYRFVGRYLILRDRDAALILDYVTKALPDK